MKKNEASPIKRRKIKFYDSDEDSNNDSTTDFQSGAKIEEVEEEKLERALFNKNQSTHPLNV